MPAKELTIEQEALKAKHGTPESFEEHVWRAVGEFISVGEARAAIAKYRAEWAVAGLPPGGATKLWNKLAEIDDA